MNRIYMRGAPIFGGHPSIIIDPATAKQPSLDVPGLCDRCNRVIFSPVTWAHLRGETLKPAFPEGENANYHIMSDLDFVVKMSAALPCPGRRGPVVDIKIAASDIVRSSTQSCTFCQILTKLDRNASILSKPQQERVVLSMQLVHPQIHSGIYDPALLEVGLHPNVSGGGEVVRLAFIDESVASSLIQNDGGNYQSRALEPLFPRIRAWIANCQETHTKCKNSDRYRLPTRVLDLRDSREHRRIKLVETKGLLENDYAMLSYVWGTSGALRLLEANQADFLTGIDDKTLPSTIWHAVVTATALHIDYLWVDSLCIVQDSGLDKVREIPRMAEYYSNASIVISASASTDVTDGFLHYQKTGPQVYELAKNPSTDSWSARYTTVPLRLPFHLAGSSTTRLARIEPSLYSYAQEPVNTRAWTLQESTLARRLVSFPRVGGVVMRCLEEEAFLGEIIGNPRTENPEFTSLGIASSGQRSGEDLSRLWCRLIETYTRRSLTYQSDVLIAIGALARSLSDHHGNVLGKYMAGLWRNNLKRELLWYTDPAEIGHPPEQILAPSWSWASCGAPVDFHNEPEMYVPGGEYDKSESYQRMFIPRWYCEIMGYEITHSSPLDPFGAVRTGTITIRAPLRRIHEYETERESSGNDPNVASSPPCLMNPKTRGPQVFSLDTIPHLVWSDDHPYYWLAIWYAGRGRARGLIVEKIEELNFRRLGFAEFSIGEDEFPQSEMDREPVISIV